MARETSKVANSGRRDFLRLAGLTAGGLTAVAGALSAGARPVMAATTPASAATPPAAPPSKRTFKAIDFSVNAWFPGIGERFAGIGHPGLGVCNRSDVGWNLPGSTDRRAECLRGWTPEYMIERMDVGGVEKSGLLACWAAYGFGGTDCRVEADEVYAAVNKYPDRFFGLVGVSPLPGRWSKYYPRTYIKYAVQQLGFKAVHMYPHWFGVKINDRKMYPIYETAAELDVPFLFQIGTGTGMSNSRICSLPEWIDDVAREFPTLKIIGIHPGGSWQANFISMFQKDPNVYWGLDAGSPSAWPRWGIPDLLKVDRGPGYQEQHQNPVDKIFWGTDFPVQDWAWSLEAFDKLGLPEEIARKVIRDNAIRLFKL